MAKRCGELHCSEDFDITGGQVGGGSVAFPVKVKTIDPPAWVKPAAATGGNERTAAHEKIVADLASALDFPVAPAMLSTKTKGKSIALPGTVALSFAALQQPKPWSVLAPTMTDTHKAALRPQLSVMLALHCWIDDHDHGGEANSLFECNADGTASAVFFDYGHSLTHEWKPPAAAPVRDWKQRQGYWAITDASGILHAIEAIGKLAVNDFGTIISRIPPDCLPADLGQHLIAALDQRRAQLKALLTGAP